MGRLEQEPGLGLVEALQVLVDRGVADRQRDQVAEDRVERDHLFCQPPAPLPVHAQGSQSPAFGAKGDADQGFGLVVDLREIPLQGLVDQDGLALHQAAVVEILGHVDGQVPGLAGDPGQGAHAHGAAVGIPQLDRAAPHGGHLHGEPGHRVEDLLEVEAGPRLVDDPVDGLEPASPLVQNAVTGQGPGHQQSLQEAQAHGDQRGQAHQQAPARLVEDQQYQEHESRDPDRQERQPVADRRLVVGCVHGVALQCPTMAQKPSSIKPFVLQLPWDDLRGGNKKCSAKWPGLPRI